jgi:hypothetical protein
MSDKTKRENIIKKTENELMRDRYVKDVGSKAVVSREKIENEGLDQLREVLQDIGKNMTEVGAVPRGMEYVGSAAVHIFKSPVLGQVAYVNQLALSSCPEALAGPAMTDLRGSAIEYYGHGRQKKKSGF